MIARITVDPDTGVDRRTPWADQDDALDRSPFAPDSQTCAPLGAGRDDYDGDDDFEDDDGDDDDDFFDDDEEDDVFEDDEEEEDEPFLDDLDDEDDDM